MIFTKNVLIFISVFLFILSIPGCSYSFTGASVPEHLKTISIPVCKDRSGSGEAELVELFTNELTKQFIDDNTLRVSDKLNSDALLDCTILSVTTAPAVVQNEAASELKVTLTVKVLYRDLVKKKTIFEKNFSNSQNYSSTEDVINGKRNALSFAIENITEDILLSVVSNW